jgi:ribonuclease P protein component
MQRLLTRSQFDAVLAGATLSRTAHFALHRCPLDCDTAETGSASPGSQALFDVRAPWIGAMVPKRWARRAVTRNLIKRQIYAVARDCTPPLNPAAYVVRLRQGFDRLQYPSAASAALKHAARAELQALFRGVRA